MTGDTLTDKQTQMFAKIEEGDTAAVLQLINDGIDIHCHDSSGMSPLSAAVYRGHTEVVELLLERGSDVNDKQHNHGYTPLMFAALSGKPELCKLLMDHGAYAYSTNTIGKTAGELAAFVGQHECTSIINNHISIDEVEKFLHPDGEKSAEQFPERLSAFIHSLCSSHQVHPISIIFRLSEYEDAMTYRKKILYVVDRVFEKQLRSKESNEVMSLKVWLILFILRETFKYVDEQVAKGKEPRESILVYAKYLLKMEPSDEVRKNLDALLRNSVAAFPYHQSLLFETMVKAISKTKFGEKPAAYDYIVQGLFGHRLLAVSKFCATCGSACAKKRCPQCKLPYCSQHCQKFDWPIHKKCCDSIKEKLAAAPSVQMTEEELRQQIENIDV